MISIRCGYQEHNLDFTYDEQYVKIKLDDNIICNTCIIDSFILSYILNDNIDDAETYSAMLESITIIETNSKTALCRAVAKIMVDIINTPEEIPEKETSTEEVKEQKEQKEVKNE